MDNSCFVNEQIHINLHGNHSESDLQIYKWSIRGEINRNICTDLKTYEHSDGNYYCIFHLPKKDKDLEEFRNKSDKLIDRIKKQIKSLEELSDNKRKIEISKLKYDFRYVRFPCHFGFRSNSIPIEIDFSHATFYEGADFMKTEFIGYANFDDVKFHKWAYFIFAKFNANAYFFDSEFFEDADFKYTFFSNGKFTNATFHGFADFGFSKFERDANFINVSFLQKASFHWAKLAIANFEDAKFSNTANFNLAEFQNYAFFKGNSENLGFGENAILDLQDARIEKPERIRFHTVRLSPNWFVNIDSRKFVFIDVYFTDSKNRKINTNFIRLNAESEIECLEKFREINNSKQLLTISCRQLADNAENNNRFEEASKFRQMAFECEWLERRERISNWWNELIDCKNVFGKLPEKIKTLPFDLIHWAYRWTSYYGESWSRATIVLLMSVFMFFPIIFALTEFQVSSKYIPLQVVVKGCDDVISELKADCKIKKRTLNLFDGEAILHSLSTATLQTVEYRVPSRWASFWMLLEKIFAPLQTALLALAIRRKFMR